MSPNESNRVHARRDHPTYTHFPSESSRERNRRIFRKFRILQSNTRLRLQTSVVVALKFREKNRSILMKCRLQWGSLARSRSRFPCDGGSRGCAGQRGSIYFDRLSARATSRGGEKGGGECLESEIGVRDPAFGRTRNLAPRGRLLYTPPTRVSTAISALRYYSRAQNQGGRGEMSPAR